MNSKEINNEKLGIFMKTRFKSMKVQRIYKMVKTVKTKENESNIFP